MSTIERDIRILKGYAGASTLLVAVLILGAFRQGTQRQEKAVFDEIDVQRINVVEPNGNYRLVISNAARSQGPLYRMKPFLYTGAQSPRAGLIFFSEEGTEVGGLIYNARMRGADSGYTALGHLSLDQFNQNQVFVIQYADRNGKRRMGIQINDRHDRNIYEWANTRDSVRKLPESAARTEALRKLETGEPGDPRVAERLYVGRDTLKNAILKLSDQNGNPRLRFVVDSLGTPSIEFLDATGRVTYRVDARGGGR